MALPLMTMVTGSSQIGKLIDMNNQDMLAHIADKLKDRELFPAKIAQAKIILSTAKLPGRMVLKSITNNKMSAVIYDSFMIMPNSIASIEFGSELMTFDTVAPAYRI